MKISSKISVAAKPRRGLMRAATAAGFAALIVAGSLGVATSAQAYTTTGCTLFTNPTTYQSIGGVAAEQANAANSWKNSTDAKLTAASSSGYTVTKKYDGATGYDGMTQWQCNPSGKSRTAQTWVNGTYTDKYAEAKRRCVWAHEMGHALGLNHSSGNVLMNPVSTTIYNTLGTCAPQADDRNGVNHLY